MKAINLPSTVTSIGASAFAYCSKLATVESLIEEPFDIDETVFRNISSSAKLIVPGSAKSRYEALDNWKKPFAEIVGFSLTINATGNGSVEYQKETVRETLKYWNVDFGNAVTLRLTPDDGYRIASLRINNTDVTAQITDNQYTIANLAEVTSVDVVFKSSVAEISADGMDYAVQSELKKTLILKATSADAVLTVPATVTYDGETWTVNGIDESVLNGKDRLAAIIWNPEAPFTASVSNPNLLLYVKQAQYAPAAINNVIVNGVAPQIVLTETASDNDFCCPQEFTAQHISYAHNYAMTTGIGESRGWESIVLPFDVQQISHQSKGEIVPFKNWKSGDLRKPFWLYELDSNGFTPAGSIIANTPYIISMPNNEAYANEFLLAGTVTFSAENTKVKKTDEAQPTCYGDRQFVASYTNQQTPNGAYILNVTNELENYTGEFAEGSRFIFNLRPFIPLRLIWSQPRRPRHLSPFSPI